MGNIFTLLHSPKIDDIGYALGFLLENPSYDISQCVERLHELEQATEPLMFGLTVGDVASKVLELHRVPSSAVA